MSAICTEPASPATTVSMVASTFPDTAPNTRETFGGAPDAVHDPVDARSSHENDAEQLSLGTGDCLGGRVHGHPRQSRRVQCVAHDPPRPARIAAEPRVDGQ